MVEILVTSMSDTYVVIASHTSDMYCASRLSKQAEGIRN